MTRHAMSPLRSVLLPCVLLVLAPPGDREEIVFRVTADTTLERTVKYEYTMQLESASMSLDGEDIPSDQLGDLDVKLQHHENYTVTDTFEAVAAGLPRRLRRKFDDLS